MFEYAADVETSEEQTKTAARCSADTANSEKEELKNSVFESEDKKCCPTIIITQCEKQTEVLKEIEAMEKATIKKPMLFAGFNERCIELKKLIEQQRAREKILNADFMDKYPSKLTKKEYHKSKFMVVNTECALDEPKTELY